MFQTDIRLTIWRGRTNTDSINTKKRLVQEKRRKKFYWEKIYLKKIYWEKKILLEKKKKKVQTGSNLEGNGC